jgi:hypothetical protein
MSLQSLVATLCSPAVRSVEVARAGLKALERRLDRLTDFSGMHAATTGTAGTRGATACLRVMEHHRADASLVSAAVQILDLHYNIDDDDAACVLLDEDAMPTLLSALRAALTAPLTRGVVLGKTMNPAARMLLRLSGSRAIQALAGASSALERLSTEELVAARAGGDAAIQEAIGYDPDASDSDESDDTGSGDDQDTVAATLSFLHSMVISDEGSRGLHELLQAGGAPLLLGALSARGENGQLVEDTCDMLSHSALLGSDSRQELIAAGAIPVLVATAIMGEANQYEAEELASVLCSLRDVLVPPSPFAAAASNGTVEAELPRIVSAFGASLMYGSAHFGALEARAVVSAGGSVLDSASAHCSASSLAALPRLLWEADGGARMTLATIRVCTRESAEDTALFCRLLRFYIGGPSGAAVKLNQHAVTAAGCIPVLLAALLAQGATSFLVLVEACGTIKAALCDCCPQRASEVAAKGATAELVRMLKAKWCPTQEQAGPILDALLRSCC